MYGSDGLYFYCYVPGAGLPPYRGWPARAGRTVRETVRSNPKRSHLDSFRLFWKSRGKSTRGVRQNYKVASPGSYRSVPRTLRPLDPGDSLSTRRSSHSTSHVMASRCRLHLIMCLVVEVWILWGWLLFVSGKALARAFPLGGRWRRSRRMRGSLKGGARFRWRKRRRSFFRCIVTGRNVSTSSDLASLGHLPLKGKTFYALLHFNQQQLSPQNPILINLTSMRRRLKGPAPQ